MAHPEVLSHTRRLAAMSSVLPVAQANQTALDRLAELAAIVMDAPIGVISLIDERHQHLIGQSGLGEPYATTRLLPVEMGFCAATLRSGAPLYIRDAGEDPVFATHPALTELGLSAYAGCPLRDQDGQLIGTVCVCDTKPHQWMRTERRALEALAESVVSELALHQDIDRRQRLLDAFEHAPAAIAVTRGPAHVIEYHNPAYQALFGHPPFGVPFREALNLPEQFYDVMDSVLATGETRRGTDTPVELDWPDGSGRRERFFDYSFSAIGGRPGAEHRGLLIVVIEVTDRVRAHRVLRDHARRQELLARASAALNRNLDPAAELRALARVVVPDLADVSTVHLLAQPVPPGQPPPLPVYTDRVAVAVAPSRAAAPPIAASLRWDGDGDPITTTIRYGRLLPEPIATPGVPPWSVPAVSADTFRTGVNHLVCAPVIVEDLVVAVVSFGLCGDRPLWSREELTALGEIARYAGIALGHGMSYQRTRDSALILQRSLLTEPPDVPGVSISARYRPAGRDEVGGDWYDAFERRPGELALTIGDVVGHDIGAAAAMAQLRATLRGFAVDDSGFSGAPWSGAAGARGEFGDGGARDDEPPCPGYPGAGPARALDRLAVVNERLYITSLATLVHSYLTYRTQSRCPLARGTLRWANAGHPPPVLVSADGHARLLDQGDGLALIPGMRRAHAEATVVLPPGATLLLYTDGLVERRDSHLDQNVAELRRCAADLAEAPLDTLCDTLLSAAPTDDDVAILAVRLEADAEAAG